MTLFEYGIGLLKIRRGFLASRKSETCADLRALGLRA